MWRGLKPADKAVYEEQVPPSQIVDFRPGDFTTIPSESDGNGSRARRNLESKIVGLIRP